MTITDEQADKAAEAFMVSADRVVLLAEDYPTVLIDGYFDLREAVRAAAQTLEPEGWRDIASAPRDGTNVLVARGDGDFPIVAYAYSDGRFTCRREDDLLYPQPTHWMPLRLLPKGPGQ